jgi:hypothetical protein
VIARDGFIDNRSHHAQRTQTPDFLMFLAVFVLVALPVLASASRMPGAFADHFSPQPRADTGR